MTRYFRCKANLNGPVLKLDSNWEAEEMKNHPDYEEVDLFGEVVKQEDPLVGTIPFQGSAGRIAKK